MDNGWIKLHRKMLDKAFSKDMEKVGFWVTLLCLANHKEREEMFGGKPIKCKPGQFTTGRKQLAELTGLNEHKVTRILEYFEKTEQQIEQQNSSKNRLITILNWDIYQIRATSEQHFEQQVSNNRATSEHTTIKKEDKKSIIKRKKSKSLDPELTLPDIKSSMISKEIDSLQNWNDLRSLWKNTNNDELIMKRGRIKYWDPLSNEIQLKIIEMIRSFGSDVQFLQDEYILGVFKNKNMSRTYLTELIAQKKSKSLDSKKTKYKPNDNRFNFSNWDEPTIK